MMGLAPRQDELFQFIGTHIKTHGFAPTVKECCFALGVKASGHMSKMLDMLSARGAIRRSSRWRGIELIHTEDHHAANCNCEMCVCRRYIKGLKLVQALEVLPPISLAGKFVGLRPLSHLTRLDWAYRDNSRVRRKPLLSAPQSPQTSRRPDVSGAA